MIRWSITIVTLTALIASWITALSTGKFTAHMLAHVAGVALAPPVLVSAFAARPAWFSAPLAAPLACGCEFLVVWGWHLPMLHAAAHRNGAVFVFEQISFLLAGVAVWGSVLAATQAAETRSRALSGVAALLVTSMHMTLLGALLSVSTRVWVTHGGGGDGLWDQQLGGIVMLGIGGLAYLAGALLLLGRALQDPVSGVRS